MPKSIAVSHSQAGALLRSLANTFQILAEIVDPKKPGARK